ncbi:IS200/IS605 family transposase [Enterococcus durans]|uniref:IS200/IS605 family transposase n=1 Tax=Enterococcus durans TaxID=53345 RepID=UPI001D0B38AB|nr:IS200/IS605 family transposase [Enterococcus durans]MCB8506839.1 IS200/IS605 family transposase [Enterococcus durans]
MADVYKGRGYVYSIQYHVGWCVKYRHDVLTGEIEKSVKKILYDIASEHEFTISEMETDKDHIHLLIECKPQHYIPNMVKALKGVSARRMFIAHPELKAKLWGGHLWNPSYFVATVSEQTEEQIRQYIRNQKKK